MDFGWIQKMPTGTYRLIFIVSLLQLWLMQTLFNALARMPFALLTMLSICWRYARQCSYLVAMVFCALMLLRQKRERLVLLWALVLLLPTRQWVEMAQFYAMRPIMEKIANEALMRPLEAGEKTQWARYMDIPLSACFISNTYDFRIKEWEPYVQVTFEKYAPDSCCRDEQFVYTVSGAASLVELEDFEGKIAYQRKIYDNWFYVEVASSEEWKALP